MSTLSTHSHWITGSGRVGAVGDPQARFPYWSFTKTVTAMCALKLVEAGVLDLDAPVEGPFEGQPYTLRQLLNHTAGLPDYGQFRAYHEAVAARETPWSRGRMLDLALSKGPLFAPGQGFSYSNVGYMFVRELIEAATGQSLGAGVQDMIARPLGLDSVALAQTRADFALLHWPAAALYDPCWVYHGCLTGSAQDAARLLKGLFDGAVLRPETLTQMRETRVLGGALQGRPWATHGYALGLMSGSVTGAGQVSGHSGAGPFCVNAVYHFADLADPVTVAVFSDDDNEGVPETHAVALALAQAGHAG